MATDNSVSQRLKNIWAEYDRQIDEKNPNANKTDYGSIFVGIRKDPPPYSATFGPFYVCVEEISMFASEYNALMDSFQRTVGTLEEINTYISTNFSDIVFPQMPTLNPNIIVPELDFQFNIVDALSGRCGTSQSIPSTILGAVQNTVKQLISNICGDVIGFLDKVNNMFAAPTAMVNNILQWLDTTNQQVKAPLAEERKAITKTLKDLRVQCKQTNNPALKIEIIQQMNLLGNLDRKVRDLTNLLNRLKSNVSELLIRMENCAKIGIALVRNVQNVLASWQKAGVCVETKFQALIRTHP